MNSTTKDFYDHGLIDMLGTIQVKFNEFQRTFTSLSYLKDLSEDHIYIRYSDVIHRPHNSSFENFTQENRDQYMRLCLRPRVQAVPARPIQGRENMDSQMLFSDEQPSGSKQEESKVSAPI